jgi:hypothetical protein
MDFLHRLERTMREGDPPDPRTRQGFLFYAAIGFALGWMWP